MKSSRLVLPSVAMVVKVQGMAVNVAMEIVRLIGQTLIMVVTEDTATLPLPTRQEAS
jgi:hypothetical protein